MTESRQDIPEMVSSDGRTVWVNTGVGCVARFCPSSREYYSGKDYSAQAMKHSQVVTAQDWTSFVEGVQQRFGIHVGPQYKPSYVVGEEVMFPLDTPTLLPQGRTMPPETIAEICYEANRALTKHTNDVEVPPSWEEASDRKSVV